MKKGRNEMGAHRKVRIIWDDPDATESDTDNENDIPGTKRAVYETVLKKVDVKRRVVKRTSSKHDEKSKKDCPSSPKVRGVRKRQSGKYAAEIREPYSRNRLWLGTYETKEMASKVYEKKYTEFNEFRIRMAKKMNSRSVGVSPIMESASEADTNVLSPPIPSPSPVLKTNEPNDVDASDSEDIGLLFLDFVATELMSVSRDSDMAVPYDDLINVDDFKAKSAFEFVGDHVKNVEVEKEDGATALPSTQGVNEGIFSEFSDFSFDDFGIEYDLMDNFDGIEEVELSEEDILLLKSCT